MARAREYYRSARDRGAGGRRGHESGIGCPPSQPPRRSSGAGSSGEGGLEHIAELVAAQVTVHELLLLFLTETGVADLPPATAGGLVVLHRASGTKSAKRRHLFPASSTVHVPLPPAPAHFSASCQYSPSQGDPPQARCASCIESETRDDPKGKVSSGGGMRGTTKLYTLLSVDEMRNNYD